MKKLALSDDILLKIEKPARYLGNEVNHVVKDPKGKIRFAMCFPDVYEIGMSHLGIQILYDLLNAREDVYKRQVSVGGSFSDPKTIDFFENLGVHIISGYGMTEAVVITNERDGRKKKGSVGEVTPGVYIRITDGEVQVSGQSVMLGYYGDPASTEAVFDDGLSLIHI